MARFSSIWVRREARTPRPFCFMESARASLAQAPIPISSVLCFSNSGRSSTHVMSRRFSARIVSTVWLRIQAHLAGRPLIPALAAATRPAKSAVRDGVIGTKARTESILRASCDRDAFMMSLLLRCCLAHAATLIQSDRLPVVADDYLAALAGVM